jgi:hypothetical protein
MTTTKIENVTVSELNLASEDRSRGVGRGYRLLTMVAVFLALCLMAVDFGRLDHVAPRHERHYGYSAKESAARRPLPVVARTLHF